MIKFIVGAIVGVLLASAVVAYGPKDTPNQIRAAGSVLSDKVVQTKFDICQRKFLDETHCYQDRKQTSAECEAQIKHQCG